MDILFFGVAWAGNQVKTKLADYRSPGIPYPPPSLADQRVGLEFVRTGTSSSTDSSQSNFSLDSTSSSPSDPSLPTVRTVVLPTKKGLPILTERILYERRTAWKLRCVSLWVRQSALLDAKARGFDSCWAGRVDRQNIKATKRAIMEAKWVADKLEQAFDWCHKQDVKKMPLKKVVTKGGKRNSSSRPMHESFPEVLYELPYPIPEPPSARDLRLTIPIPPRWVDCSNDSTEVQGLPCYSVQVDEASGERVLENVRWDDPPTTTTDPDRR